MSPEEVRVFRNCSVWGGANTYFGEERVALRGDLRQGETIQVNYKMNFIVFLKILLFHRYFYHLLRRIPIL